mgnify:CR=1 FL=1
MSGLQVQVSGRRLGKVPRHAGTDAAGRVLTARLGDRGEARLAGLQARHGALVVQAVEHLVVVHHLGLVLWVGNGVPHVLAGARHHLVRVGPLQDVASDALSHVTSLHRKKLVNLVKPPFAYAFCLTKKNILA